MSQGERTVTMASTDDNSLTYHQNMATSSWHSMYSNFEKLCRLCGLQSDFMMPIFDGEGLQHRLDHKIQTYLYLQVFRDDVLPLQLCYDCVSTLLSWDTLFLKCQNTEHKFQSMLGSKEQVELTERQGSVLIASYNTSQHKIHSPSHFMAVPHNDPSLTVGDSIVQHVVSPAPHINSNQSCYPEGMQPILSPLLPHSIIHEVALPSGEDVLEGSINSDSSVQPVPAGDELLGLSYTLAATITKPAYSGRDQQIPLCESKQSEIDAEDQSASDHSCCANKKLTCEKKICKQTPVLKMKKILSQSDSSVFETESPLFSVEDERVSLVTNQVSAIRSTSNRNFELECGNSCNRLKSVLVRNESIQPLTEEVPAKVDTVIESAVIRKHYNIETISKSGQGSVVSVVRPTCLRRAPTAVVVIEKIDGGYQFPEESQTVKQTSKVFEGSQQESTTFTQNFLDCKDVDVDADSFGLPSPIYSHEERTRASDLSQSCFHCGKFISNLVLLLSHERSHLVDESPPNIFVCKFCSLPQRSLSEMHSHYNIHVVGLDRVRRGLSNRKAHMCKQCGLMLTTEDRLAAHMRLHADTVESYGHECKTCGKTFNTRSKLSVHLWTHALKPSLKTFKCHICGKGFGTKPAVMEHRLKHTEEEKSRAFKCVICDLAFGNNTLLGKHRLTHSKEELARPFKCSFCGKAFARNHTLQIHYFTHSKEKSHPCSQCGKCFKMRNSLIQHLRIHQDPNVFPTHPCLLCGKTFRVKSRLRDHLRLHSGDKPYKCATCGKCFHKIGALHTHKVSHTERRPYGCDVCGKAFKWSKNLRQHISIHSDRDKVPPRQCMPDVFAASTEETKPQRQNVQCEICGKRLSGTNSLRTHKSNMHNGRKPKETKATVCSVCGKVLSTSGALARHMKTTHGGVKAFKCDFCDRKYSTKVARDDHRRSHTGERPYSCSICSKTFTSLSNLHIHRSSHSEDRPYKCSYCDKQFKRRAHLIPHIRTHTGEKPYVCDICSRGFAQSNDLHKHRLTHSEVKAFTCHCGMAYRIKRDLIRHQAKHHPNLPLAHGPLDGQKTFDCEANRTAQKQELIMFVPKPDKDS